MTTAPLTLPRSGAGFSGGESRTLLWTGAAAGLAIAATGWAAGDRMLMLEGAAAAGIFASLLAPEILLALFVVVGGLKAAPWLAAAPADLTVLSAIGVLAAVLVLLLRRERDAPGLPVASVLMAALATVIAASVLWTPVPSAGLSKALRFETLTVLSFFAPILLVRSRASITRLMVAFVAFGVLVAATAVSTGNIEKPTAIAGGNHIELGRYAGLGLIAIVGYLIFATTGVSRLLWLLPAGFLLQTVLISGSRGAVVSAFVAIVFILVARALSSSHRVAAIAVAAGIAIVLVAIGIKFAGPAVAKYQQDLLTTNTASIEGQRSFLYHTGVGLARDHPLGLGAAAFPETVPGYPYPHNIFLELADEFGLVAVALFGALVVAAWRARRAAAWGATGPAAMVAGALILFNLVEAQFSLGLNDNRPLFFSLGLAFALPRLVRADDAG